MRLQGERRRRQTLRSPDDDRQPHGARYILYQVRGDPRVEICERFGPYKLATTLANEVISFQDRAYDPSQKYKEGKYILERNLLVDVQ